MHSSSCGKLAIWRTLHMVVERQLVRGECPKGCEDFPGRQQMPWQRDNPVKALSYPFFLW